VQEAVEKANEVLRNPEFYAQVAQQSSFDLATIPPKTVAGLMYDARLKITVDLYYSVSPLSNIDGYDDQDRPDVVHLNIWKIDRSVASICNSIIHGAVHAVNAQINLYYFNHCYFGHGDSRREGKEKTAPYAIGAIAQKLLSKDEAIIVPLEHDPFVLTTKTTQNVTRSLFAGL
jgi:hypothetical protein